jgi:CheY-like chemotaxis protein
MLDTTYTTPEPPRRILLVDDDPAFGAVLRQAARKRGIDLVHCVSIAALTRIRNIESFDVALVDYHLGRLKGSTVSDFLNLFFGAVPVAIVSATSDWWFATNLDFATCVKTFIHKERSADDILDFAIDLARPSPRQADIPDPYADPDNDYAAFARSIRQLWPEELYRGAMAAIGNRLLAGISVFTDR